MTKCSYKSAPNTIQHNNNVNILGVTLDAHMPLEQQISNTCRTSYMQIRRIRSMRRYLTVDAARTLLHATVTVRLDYCNSIYTNMPMTNIHRLQITQNSSERHRISTVNSIIAHEHITNVLVQLHLLPYHKEMSVQNITYAI